MIDCTSFEKMFPEAVAGKLSSNDMSDFAEHRRLCPDCAQFTETDAYYRTRLQTVGFVPNVPPLRIAFQRDRQSLAKRRNNILPLRTLSLAAGFVLGVLIVGSVLFRTPGSLTGTPGMTAYRTADTTHPPVVQAPQMAVNDNRSSSAKAKDSVKSKSETQPIPSQFPALQVVNSK